MKERKQCTNAHIHMHFRVHYVALSVIRQMQWVDLCSCSFVGFTPRPKTNCSLYFHVEEKKKQTTAYVCFGSESWWVKLKRERDNLSRLFKCIILPFFLHAPPMHLKAWKLCTIRELGKEKQIFCSEYNSLYVINLVASFFKKRSFSLLSSKCVTVFIISFEVSEFKARVFKETYFCNDSSAKRWVLFSKKQNWSGHFFSFYAVTLHLPGHRLLYELNMVRTKNETNLW